MGWKETEDLKNRLFRSLEINQNKEYQFENLCKGYLPGWDSDCSNGGILLYTQQNANYMADVVLTFLDDFGAEIWPANNKFRYHLSTSSHWGIVWPRDSGKLVKNFSEEVKVREVWASKNNKRKGNKTSGCNQNLFSRGPHQHRSRNRVFCLLFKFFVIINNEMEGNEDDDTEDLLEDLLRMNNDDGGLADGFGNWDAFN